MKYKIITLFSVATMLFSCSKNDDLVTDNKVEHIEYKRNNILYRTENLSKTSGGTYMKVQDNNAQKIYINLEDVAFSEGKTYSIPSNVNGQDIKMFFIHPSPVPDTVFTAGTLKITKFNTVEIEGTFSATKAKGFYNSSQNTDSLSAEFNLPITEGNFYFKR